MNKYSKKKAVLGYYYALQNEIAIDYKVYKLINLIPKDLFFFPRPSGVIKSAIRKKIFLYLISKTWNHFGFFLFLSYKLLIRLQFISLKSKIEFINGNLALGFSSKAIEIFNYLETGSKFRILKFPWLNANGTIANHLTEVKCFLTFKNIIDAYYLSILSKRLLKKRIGSWGLQNYTSYDWFLTYIFMYQNTDGPYIIAEHYDRWATLSDVIIDVKKSNSYVTIVQHGLVTALSNDKLSLFYRLRSVRNLFVFDEQSYDFFLNTVIDSNSIKPTKSFYKSNLILQPRIDLANLMILVIGNFICWEYHKLIITKLLQKDYFVYYKPHPNDNLSTFKIQHKNYYLVEDTSFFPDVDFVISYESTLAYDYERLGYKVIKHDMNEKKDDVVHSLINQGLRFN